MCVCVRVCVSLKIIRIINLGLCTSWENLGGRNPGVQKQQKQQNNTRRSFKLGSDSEKQIELFGIFLIVGLKQSHKDKS